MGEFNYNVKPFFSVLMLTYNHRDYIFDAITSIFKQEYKDFFEFIILDDCSNDDTWNIVKSTVSKFKPSHIKVVMVQHRENIGSVRNFNHGLTLSSGAMIVVADGDDVSHPSRLSRLQDLHAHHSKSLYISNAKIIRQNSQSKSPEKKFYTDFDFYNLSYHDIFTNKTPIFGASYAFERNLFNEYGIVDPVWVTYNNVDQQIFWRAYLKKGVFYTSECLIDYRVHDRGMSINKVSEFKYKNKEKYFLNRIGNVLYILQDVLLRRGGFGEENNILFGKIKDDFSKINSILCEKNILKESLSEKVLWIGRGDTIVLNGVSIERNIAALKKLRVDELIFVLNFLFSRNEMGLEKILWLSDLCRRGDITKNEIIVLFYLLNPNGVRSIGLKTRDRLYLFWHIFLNRFRVFNILYEMKK